MTTYASSAIADADGTLLTASVCATGGPWVIDALPSGGTAPTVNTGSALVHQTSFDETSARLPNASAQTDYRVTGTVSTRYTAHGSIDGELYVGGRLKAGGWNGYVFGWQRDNHLVLRKYRNVGAAQQYYTVASASQAQPTDGTHTYEVIFVTNGSGHTEITCKYDGAIAVDQWTETGVTYEAEQLSGDGGIIQWSGQNFATKAASDITLDAMVVDSVPTGAQKLRVTTQAGGAIPATVFDVQPVVALKDYFGATVTGTADTITVSKVSGPGTITGTLAQAVNTSTGLATWTNLQASLAGTYTLLYTSATYGTVTSSPFTVVPPSANFSAGMLTTALSDVALGALSDGGFLEIRNGTQPANTGVAATGTIGATIQFDPHSSMSFGTQGVTTFNPPASVTASNTITPTWARLYKADHTTVLMDVACNSTTGPLILTAAAMTAGQRVQLECLALADSTVTVTHATTVYGECAIGGTMDGPAEQLRATVDVSMPTVTGTTRTVGTSGRMYSNLQTAINACVGGDEIVVDNGYDYLPGGTAMVLPAHSGASYVTIRPATLTTAVGSRMTPAGAATDNLPKIRIDNGNSTITCAPGSAYWRLVGLEVLPTVVPQTKTFFPVTITPNTGTGNQGTTYADIPHHIILDRCYIHGSAVAGTINTEIVTAVYLNGDNTALINSTVADIGSDNVESHGVGSYMAKGPIQINNNYIEATGQSVLVGGAESNYQGVCLGDFECRYNTLSKPVAWRGVHNYIKTLFEVKAGKRVLFEGNQLINSWEGSQGWYGSTITCKSTNQNGALVPWVRASDITIRNNKVTCAGTLFNAHPLPGGLPNLSNCTAMSRISVHNNLAAHMADFPATASPVSPFSLVRAWGISIDAGPRAAMTDLLVQHNTYVCPSGNGGLAKAISFGGQQQTNQNLRVKIWDNVFAVRSINPIGGDAIGYVDEALAQWMGGAGSSLARNVTSSSGFEPSGSPASVQGLNNTWLTNSTDATFPELAFANMLTEDYSLGVLPTYATDGTPPGVNMATLRAAIGGQPAASATQLVVARQPSAITASGIAHATQPVVQVQDGTGAVVTTDTSTVTASLVVESGGALPFGTLSHSAVAGVVTFAGLGATTATGATAHWLFVDGALTIATSVSFTVTPAVTGVLDFGIPTGVQHPYRLRFHRWY